MPIYSNENGTLVNMASDSGGGGSGALDNHIKILFLGNGTSQIVGSIVGDKIGSNYDNTRYYKVGATIQLASDMMSYNRIIFIADDFGSTLTEWTSDWSMQSATNLPGDLTTAQDCKTSHLIFQSFNPTILYESASTQTTSYQPKSILYLPIGQNGSSVGIKYNTNTSFIVATGYIYDYEGPYSYNSNYWYYVTRPMFAILGIK